MKHRLFRVLCILLAFGSLLGSTGDISNWKVSKISFGNSLGGLHESRTRRSLLSHSSEHDTALVAALDGTIHLLELKSAKVLWSFAAGPPIYSSYQAPINHDHDKENSSGPGGGYFVDCGDDWKLYANTALGKVKLDRTPEEFLHITPHIAEDGGVVLGSKKTTVFLIDAKTGRLIYTYSLSDYGPTTKSNGKSSALYDKPVEEMDKSQMPLYITRTDYLLKSFAPNSDNVLWNLTVADIGAAYLCQNSDSEFSGTPSESGYELPSEPGVGFNMPLPCQSRAVVFRLRGHGVLESFSGPDRLPNGHDDDMMLPMSPRKYMLPSQPRFDIFLEYYQKFKTTLVPTRNPVLPSEVNVDETQMNNHDVPLSLPPVTKNSGISEVQDAKLPYGSRFSMLLGGSNAMYFIMFLLIAMGILKYQSVQGELTKGYSNVSPKPVPSKKRKSRKSGKNNDILGKKDKPSLDPDVGSEVIESDNNALLNLSQLINGGADGRMIGKLFVSNREIAQGSNGTIVLEGFHDGRSVAVKRLVKAHHDIAYKEIQNLIASDRHPNIVRWYGVESDQDFVYLSLERCTCSLYDLIQIQSDLSETSASTNEPVAPAMVEYKVRLDLLRNVIGDTKLWKANGCPSPILLQLMRDVISGLVHLHELGIVHRDLKPQNVLIIKERALRAKLSDMGISKRLVGDMSSLGHHATGYGSSGWQAPEQLLHERQTRAVDMFSLGCVLFFCITGGQHPFGSHLERDVNILKNKVDLFLVDCIPEAADLFSHLLDPLAELRPKALEVLYHPLFWSSEMRLSFLRDTSDLVELEDRETNSDILAALESVAPIALGGNWDEKMEPAFISNIGRYRRYKFESVRDLLRVMRNKLNHYRELPKEVQELLGPVPEGFDGYFSSRFPKLLIEVHKVMYKYCRKEECFNKYFISNDL